MRMNIQLNKRMLCVNSNISRQNSRIFKMIFDGIYEIFDKKQLNTIISFYFKI